jgi:hypothetical protein
MSQTTAINTTQSTDELKRFNELECSTVQHLFCLIDSFTCKQYILSSIRRGVRVNPHGHHQSENPTIQAKQKGKPGLSD